MSRRYTLSKDGVSRATFRVAIRLTQEEVEVLDWHARDIRSHITNVLQRNCQLVVEAVIDDSREAMRKEAADGE